MAPGRNQFPGTVIFPRGVGREDHEWRLPAKKFICQTAEGVLITGRGCLGSAPKFGSLVVLSDSQLGLFSARDCRLREIGQQHVLLRIKEHVSYLEVAMSQPLLMQKVQSLSRLPQHQQRE